MHGVIHIWQKNRNTTVLASWFECGRNVSECSPSLPQRDSSAGTYGEARGWFGGVSSVIRLSAILGKALCLVLEARSCVDSAAGR